VGLTGVGPFFHIHAFEHFTGRKIGTHRLPIRFMAKLTERAEPGLRAFNKFGSLLLLAGNSNSHVPHDTQLSLEEVQ
jgi:hypothetical protein